MTSNPAVVAALRAQRIELPSWAFGNSGTRFKVFAQKGVPRTPQEKVADAAQVNLFTGVAPTVALHIPWDRVDDYGERAMRRTSESGSARSTRMSSGRRLHAGQRLQSGCGRASQGARPPARVHRRHGCDRVTRPEAVVLGRHELPGPGRHARPRDRLAEALAAVHARLGPDQRMLLEYKFFEPSFYTMDVPDWGRHTSSASPRGRKPRSWSIPATTPRARTSSSSSRRCCGRAASAAFDFNSVLRR